MAGDRLKIGITCYPSVGGSGILASALGEELARVGHEVHFISYERPFRLPTKAPRLHFHPVAINDYGLFKYPDYTLPLSVRMAEVSRDHELDVLHVHYAVPHATAAILARSMLPPDQQPRVVTTLHGTDTTLLGRDAGYGPAIRHALIHSDAVTTVSDFLRDLTLKLFDIDRTIDTIHNFFVPRAPMRPVVEVRAELGLLDQPLKSILALLDAPVVFKQPLIRRPTLCRVHLVVGYVHARRPRNVFRLQQTPAQGGPPDGRPAREQIPDTDRTNRRTSLQVPAPIAFKHNGGQANETKRPAQRDDGCRPERGRFSNPKPGPNHVRAGRRAKAQPSRGERRGPIQTLPEIVGKGRRQSQKYNDANRQHLGRALVRAYCGRQNSHRQREEQQHRKANQCRQIQIGGNATA